MTASEWGIDPGLDPRSFEAAVQWRAVREAERIVERVAQPPTRGIASIMFDALRRAHDDKETS